MLYFHHLIVLLKDELYTQIVKYYKSHCLNLNFTHLNW